MELFDRRTAPKRSDAWYVYALVDSRNTNDVRYVGITNNPKSRFACHVSTAPRESTRKARWIVSVLRDEGQVLMGILASGLSHEDAKSHEIAIIADGLSDLTNLTAGGDGTIGYAHDALAKAKMREARLGKSLSLDTRAKISIAHTGMKRPLGTGAKISASKIGKKRPPSVGIAVGNAHRGKKLTDEHRAKLSVAQIRIALRPNDKSIRAGLQRLAGPKINNKSGFKGVIWDKKTNNWRAQLNKDGSGTTAVGRFPTPELAALAYDRAAFDAWGGSCFLNFPVAMTASQETNINGRL